MRNSEHYANLWFLFRMKSRWILAIFTGIILSVYALYPQINMWKQRGDNFQGAFASCDLDEMAYASYLQALIDGRPRKNDPYTGRDEAPENPQPESLFSIQFVPAYMAAIPARILGLSASQMMPVVSVFSAFLTALALFWLIFFFTGDELFAMAGTLVVMVGAALIVGIGAINGFYEDGAAYPFFPYLRRPIPSLGFPFLFAFFACLWNGINAEMQRKRVIYSILASLCFAALVFSYFYLWTSAAAVLFALTLFVIVFRSEHWRRDFIFLAITGVLCLLPLAVYAVLLSNRNPMSDKAQLLVFTRQSDLLRTVEVIGYATLVLTVFALLAKVTRIADRKAFFIAAFAAAPFLVFNQQIITGRSLQPFHYEFYVINYVVLLSCVLLVSIFWQRFLSNKRAVSLLLISVITVAAIAWGYIEATETTKFWDDINVTRDEAMPVNLRLRELAGGDIEAAKRQTTLNLEALQADSQPTVAPQSVLWARHQNTFAGLTSWEENKRRYYQLLYYSDLNVDSLRKSLTGCQDIEACMALFGWDRFNARLSANARPLTRAEIEEEVKTFDEFSRNSGLREAQDSHLSYLVVYADSNNRLVNIDRWFERDAGEKLGKYTLFRLRLKQF